MGVYAIGDIQGCYDALQKLLTSLRFNPAEDELWLTGDLVNRGPDSLAVLEFVKGLGSRAKVVLGNHDLHLLAVSAGKRPLKGTDTFDDVLKSSHGNDLLYWLRQQPLFHHDPGLGFAMTHAGILPQWSLRQAAGYASEISDLLRNDDRYVSVLGKMYGNKPNLWREEFIGMKRIRVLINVFTRLRFCEANGRMDFDLYRAPGSQPKPLSPWYELRDETEHPIVFGHWSTLGAGFHKTAISLDSGCVWGGQLTAIRLDPKPLEFMNVSCD